MVFPKIKSSNCDIVWWCLNGGMRQSVQLVYTTITLKRQEGGDTHTHTLLPHFETITARQANTGHSWQGHTHAHFWAPDIEPRCSCAKQKTSKCFECKSMESGENNEQQKDVLIQKIVIRTSVGKCWSTSENNKMTNFEIVFLIKSDWAKDVGVRSFALLFLFWKKEIFKKVA